MALFASGNKEKPVWLEQTREFCRRAGITVTGWGPDLLTVEAKSPRRAKEIASQLSQLGFKPIENEDDAYAGMLNLSQNPAAIQSKLASFDISRRPWNEQIEPLIWALGSLLLVPGLDSQHPERYWVYLLFGLLSLVLFFFEASRIWGWRAEILPEALRVRRRFRWTTIPWDQIHTVETRYSGNKQERVFLKLTSHTSVQLGSFFCAFARNLRDRLRQELAWRRTSSP